MTISTGIVSTIAGTGTQGYSGDNGQATSAALYNPFAVALDSSGNVYINDSLSNRIRKVTVSTGVITTIAGSSTSASYSGDGGPATSATLYYPAGVALDSSGVDIAQYYYMHFSLIFVFLSVGNVYISDQGNNRIRKVTVSTGIITTIAGSGGTGSFSGDNGAATSATLSNSKGICVDVLGTFTYYTISSIS